PRVVEPLEVPVRLPSVTAPQAIPGTAPALPLAVPGAVPNVAVPNVEVPHAVSGQLPAPGPVPVPGPAPVPAAPLDAGTSQLPPAPAPGAPA
ncbi:hypothetical protein C6A88_16755, partial [Mycolicibacterium austroafricanum]